MTSTLTEPIVTTCPSWCTLEPDHGWDSIYTERGVWSRGHGGPTFGRFLFTGGTEYSTAPGVVANVVVEIHTDEHAMNELTPIDLLDLAADAVVAAEWLERVR